MKRFLSLICLVALLAPAPVTLAQQSQAFDHYTVHYNAINTSQLTPEVAQGYGIQRSSSRALLNITVLDADDEPVSATVAARAKNLTGQRRDIEMRKLEEPDNAIYYIGVFRVNNMETFDFTVDVKPDGSDETLEVNFRQQFYTE
jgi:hypothetical protein